MHVKPTPEELELNAQKSLEELDKIENNPTPPEPDPNPDPTPDPEVTVTPPDEETPPDETKDDDEVKTDPQTPPQPPEDPDKKVEPKQTQENDWKTRYTESTREAQILYEKDKEMSDAIEKANALPAPTEDELKGEYPEWEDMSSLERRLATDNFVNKRRFQLLDSVHQKRKDFEAWNGKVDTYVTDPKTLVDHPELEGKQEEFKIFATKPSRRGVDFDVLVSSFLYDAEKTKPKHKGSMFPTGSGGLNDRQKPKTDILTVQQGRDLMKTDFKRYSELLKAGKIANE